MSLVTPKQALKPSRSEQASVLMLFFGNYVRLHMRLLDSLTAAFAAQDPSSLCDIRIGLNRVCDHTRNLVYSQASAWKKKLGIPVYTYTPHWSELSPAYKYPVYRKMLYSWKPPGEVVVWFDDDSYLDPVHNWFTHAMAAIGKGYTAVGPMRRCIIGDGPKHFLRSQPWYSEREDRPQIKLGASYDTCFPQGGLQVLRRDDLYALDWPWIDLRHAGGDTMLGEAMRHMNMQMLHWPVGTHTNASADGKEDLSPRRGLVERPLCTGADVMPSVVQHDVEITVDEI